MGKKERKKERRRSFKLRAQVSSRAAARGQIPTLLLLHPSAPPQEGRKKKALRHSRATTILSSSQNSELADRESAIVVSPIRFFLACFVSVLESIFLGGILRFLEAFFFGGQ